MPAPYEIRAGGDVKNKKQSMADLKLRRLNELNSRLKEDLERPRIKVSEASMSYVPRISLSFSLNRNPALLIQYCQNTKDFMVPSLWGQVDKREDPYAPQQPNGCYGVALTPLCHLHWQYAQELLSTFSTSLGEVALVPATGGIFTVDIVHSSTSESHSNPTFEAQRGTLESQMTQLWDRKTEGGFPAPKHKIPFDLRTETKQLKKLVRDIIEPSRDLGHVDRHGTKPNVPIRPIQTLVQAQNLSIDSPSITSAAETMVTSIMSAHPDRPKNDDHNHQSRSAEITASQTAEQMVADIMDGFQGGIKEIKEPEIAGRSEELGTRPEGASADAGPTHEKDEGEVGIQGVHSARQGCEDCG
ncbi:MAG: hypothetical protein Q9186_005543 [Xanthomendoza sp. 1 TL-2023]